MNGGERIEALFEGKASDRTGFWHGNPTAEAKVLYRRDLGLEQDGTGLGDVDLAALLGSDLYWCSPELDPDSWKHPENKPMFDCYGGKERVSLGQPGVFAGCEDSGEVEAFDWPDPDFLDFTSTLKILEYARSKGMAVVGGMWIPFFHVVSDFMGMENYFIKMHTHPKVVEAVTEKVLSFYLEANRRFLEVAAPKLSAFFFGNDLGGQQDLLIGPEDFETFVLPGIQRVVSQAKSFSLKVMMHSCGAISKIIPRLVDAGIDALHPLQARAKGMDAESLARAYKGDLVFVGGVDTQVLLPFRSPEEVRDEVQRLKKVFGERYVVSPSHEALLPNVSLKNVLAMREAATA